MIAVRGDHYRKQYHETKHGSVRITYLSTLVDTYNVKTRPPWLTLSIPNTYSMLSTEIPTTRYHQETYEYMSQIIMVSQANIHISQVNEMHNAHVT